nr:hypothetical protein [Brucella intermedia]
MNASNTGWQAGFGRSPSSALERKALRTILRRRSTSAGLIPPDFLDFSDDVMSFYLTGNIRLQDRFDLRPMRCTFESVGTNDAPNIFAVTFRFFGRDRHGLALPS